MVNIASDWIVDRSRGESAETLSFENRPWKKINYEVLRGATWQEADAGSRWFGFAPPTRPATWDTSTDPYPARKFVTQQALVKEVLAIIFFTG